MAKRFKLNNRGKVAVALVLMVVAAAFYFIIRKVTTPQSPFQKDAVYSCIILRKVESSKIFSTSPFESYGVYCPEASQLGEIKISFWKGGEKLSVFRGAKFPHEVKLDGGKLHQVKKGDWDYEE